MRYTTKLVWAATKWIAGCKGWRVEDGKEEWGSRTDQQIVEPLDEGQVWVAAQPIPEGAVCRREEDEVQRSRSTDERARVPRDKGEFWAVRKLERNMFQFLGLEDRGP